MRSAWPDKLLDKWQSGNLPAAYAAAYPGPERFKDYAIAELVDGDKNFSLKMI
jgi:hypothetical protein